jgi:hypothetical protein
MTTVMKSYRPIVGEIARAVKPRTILDLLSGEGWLADEVNGADVAIDGIDLYEGQPNGYHQFLAVDLEAGVSESLGTYDMVRRRLLAIGEEPQTPPHAERVADNDARFAMQPLHCDAGVVGLSAAGCSEKPQAIIERGVRDRVGGHEFTPLPAVLVRQSLA